MEAPIDTTNNFLVGIAGTGGAVMFNPPQRGQVLEKDESLRLAAWIVLMVNDDARFEAIKQACMET